MSDTLGTHSKTNDALNGAEIIAETGVQNKYMGITSQIIINRIGFHRY